MKHVEHLERLRAQLTELLGLLENEDADPETLVRAMQSCTVVFEALRAGFPAVDDLEAEERERLTEEIEQTLRLNAVALNCANTAGERLAAGIHLNKQARRHARALSSEGAPGATCDLSV